MSKPLVLFVRVHKTASTLLHCMVENTLGKEAVLLFDCYDARGAGRAIAAGRTDATFLASAHMPYGAHRHLPVGCEYVTIVRDPVDRVASLYHHVQMPHLREHWMHLPGATMAQWLAWQRSRRANTCNAAVRFLAGYPVDNGHPQSFCPMTDADLELAKRHLRDDFPLVGVMERLEPFVRAFEARHEIPAHPMGHVNGRRGVPPYGQRPTDRESLPGEVVAAIDADNILDLELYRFVRDELAP